MSRQIYEDIIRAWFGDIIGRESTKEFFLNIFEKFNDMELVDKDRIKIMNISLYFIIVGVWYSLCKNNGKNLS